MYILKNENLTFVHAGLFRTRREWIHPERVESTYEIIYVTAGEVHIEENGEEHTLSAGQLILLEPGRVHRGTKKSSNVGFYWLHFSVSGGELPFEKRRFDNFDSSYLFRELLHHNNIAQRHSHLVDAILCHLLCELECLSSDGSGAYDERAEKIYEWMRINALASTTVRGVAEHFGYSCDHVSRICKRAYGIGARELLDRFIINRAKELLCNTDKYVKEIAAELEFSSDKAFIGFFKYHEGVFPEGFRRRLSKTHMNSK